MNHSISTETRDACYVLLKDGTEYIYPLDAMESIARDVESKKFVKLNGEFIRSSEVKAIKRSASIATDRWKMTPSEKRMVNAWSDELKRSMGKAATDCHIERWLYRIRSGLDKNAQIPAHIGRDQEQRYICDYGEPHDLSDPCECSKDYKQMSGTKFFKKTKELGFSIRTNDDIKPNMQHAVKNWIKENNWKPTPAPSIEDVENLNTAKII